MEKLREMYYEFNGSDEFMELGDLPETVKARDELYDNVLSHIGEDDYTDAEFTVAGFAAENEAQGFIYGFRHAVQIMTECGFALPAGMQIKKESVAV